MNSFLLNRQLGSVSPQALAQAQNQHLLQALQAAPNVHFSQVGLGENEVIDAAYQPPVAHAAGVNSIAIDRFEGRYLLSGGADSSVAIWDLERAESTTDGAVRHLPLGRAAKTSTTGRLGITRVSFYPFDSLAFLTSGYDRTLKLFDSQTLSASATFDLESTVHAHATSTVATHLLVACASQHPAVRLVDLRTGSSTHSLAGHSGSVLSVAWHPKNENILASGATDGTCRLWDVRRSASSLGVLDMDDSIGVVGYDGKGLGSRRRERGKAHNGAVNGTTWTEDGRSLVTTGTDKRMRVFDMSTGANTLANFGPALENSHNTTLTPLIPPSMYSHTRTIYYPNANEILCFGIQSGSLQKRLRVPQSKQYASQTVRNPNRTTSLAWRAHHVEIYSSHADGTIRCWRPRTAADVEAEEEGFAADETAQTATAERKRKRDELNQIVQGLTKRREM
ncbi:hypothetical protein LTS02_010477 [Friedmanniomyces endolithicus]|nr:hypothetical protein LTS02_010477 [Friedmanniomyces endolithicus]KAK0882143.1 hypothetical protein LTR87_004098 [Friedmanniomyces endolithicus]